MSDPADGSGHRGKPARLAGRRAVVTGGGRGIGRSITIRFLEEGSSVVIVQRAEVEGATLEADLKERWGEGRVRFMSADIRSDDSVATLMNGAAEFMGGIDLLCNNAGVGLLKSVHETSREEYDEVMDTNVRGVFLCSGKAIPHLRDAGGGSIVNVSSVAASVGFELDAAYCTSKGAVDALTRQMAVDYASDGIRVNSVSPGFIVTEMMRKFVSSHADPDDARQRIEDLHPLGRMGTPEEVAAATAFLASDDASFITGVSLPVDGGLLAR